MKAKVRIGFIDKHTKERYHPGMMIEVAEERAKEILEKGKLIEIVPEEQSAEPKEVAGLTEEETTQKRKPQKS